MLKLGIFLALLAGAAATAAWAPVHGRTVLDRWRAAPDASTFASRAYDEAKAALVGHGDARPARTARGPKPAARPGARPARPSESHTEQDREALDRIVAERAAR